MAATCPTPATAQVFGQFTGAPTVQMNSRLAGAYLTLGDHETSAIGQLRLSFHPDLDLGFQGGVGRLEVANTHRTQVKLGSDLKAYLMKPTKQRTVGLAVDGAIGIETAEGFTTLLFGPSVVVSSDLRWSRARAITPYASLGLLYARTESNGVSDTEASVPLRFGASMQVASGLDLVAELQWNASNRTNDDVRFGLGAGFPF